MNDPHKLGMASGRLEALGDGIFSVAMTILVLELALPVVKGNTWNDFRSALHNSWNGLLCYMLSFIVLGIMCFKSTRIKSKGMFSATNLDVTAVDDIGFNFDNVAGNEEAKDSVQDVVDFLKKPEKYSAYGARMPKGVILYG